MQTVSYANQNQLRQYVRASWSKPHNLTDAIILNCTDLAETAHVFRMFASELGARFIPLDIDHGLTDTQRELLSRNGPRIVLMTGLETMAEDDLIELPSEINAGGRALPIIIWKAAQAESDVKRLPSCRSELNQLRAAA